jgi:hypothetical protein
MLLRKETLRSLQETKSHFRSHAACSLFTVITDLSEYKEDTKCTFNLLKPTGYVMHQQV